MLRSILEYYGFRVTHAETGEKGLELLQDGTYDLILLDIKLPGIDGIETMRRIRLTEKNRIPVVALTAYAMKGDEERYLSLGFAGYVSKPFEVKALLRAIQKPLHLAAF